MHQATHPPRPAPSAYIDDATEREADIALLRDVAAQTMALLDRLDSAIRAAGAPDHDLTMDYLATAKSLRYTILLKTHLATTPDPARSRLIQQADRNRRDIGKQLQARDLIEDAIATQPHPPAPPRLETLRRERDERLEHRDIAGDLARFTVKGIALRICTELGIPLDTSQWTRSDRIAAHADAGLPLAAWTPTIAHPPPPPGPAAPRPPPGPS